MSAALKIKTPRATKQARKTAKREQGHEAAVCRLRETAHRDTGRIGFLPLVLADALDSKGAVVLVSGECRVFLSADVRKGVVSALRAKAAIAWLDTSGKGTLRVRWTTIVNGRACEGGYNLACDLDTTARPIVLDGATDPSTGAVITAIVATTVGAFRRAFEAAMPPRNAADRDSQRAMRLLPLDSGRGMLLSSTDGNRAHYAALPAQAGKVAPVIPAALVNRIPGLIHGLPEGTPLRIVRSDDGGKAVVEVRAIGHRIAEHVTDEDARFPDVARVLRQARELSGTATVGLSYAQLAGAIGKRPKVETITVAPHADGIRVSWDDPSTGDARIDVACDASVDTFPPTAFFPRYLLDALQACGGDRACEVRLGADPCDPCLVRGPKGMAVVMPKRIK